MGCRWRCGFLFDYFQDWLKELLKPETSRAPPAFSPPKPTLIDGLNMLRTVSASLFPSSEFKAAIQRTFVKVGLAEEASGTFRSFTGSTRGTIAVGYFKPADDVPDDEFTLESVAVEMDMEPRRLGNAFDDVADEGDPHSDSSDA